MKKSLILLVVLLAAGGFVFAEAGVSGEAMFGVVDLFSGDVDASALKAEINIDADISDYTSVSVELDIEGTDWDGQEEAVDDPATTDEDESLEYLDSLQVGLDDFRISSNVLGELGVEDVSLTFTVGLFDTYFCNWNYVSRSGEEYYSSDVAGDYLWNAGPDTDIAFAADLGAAGYNLMYWMDFEGTQMNVAVSGTPIEGGNFCVGYYGAFDAIADGNLWIEGGYEFAAGPATMLVPASFAYDIDEEVYGWSSGVAADIDAYHFSVGVGGTSETAAFADCLVELSTSVVENADIYAVADLDFAEDTPFQSVDLGGQYNFGPFGVGAGYVIASSDDVSTSLWSGTTSMSGSGIYLCADVDF